MSTPPLTPTRVRQVRAIFEQALMHPADERTAFVRDATAGDAALETEVQSLLDALARDPDTWMRPRTRELNDALTETAQWRTRDAVIGTRIGPYLITRLIGVGGMGAVFEGVRADDQYEKRVALKFLRRGYEGDLAVRRLRYERQILANLSHPNIAALLDGGVTDDEQPYIVMEFVDGVPITTFAQTHALDVRARVRLLCQVCHAVQHAHQNLVVHRDLKPGNILVTPDGVVKLLDFGIARLLRDAEGADALPATRGGAQAFTPDYASPEQMRGEPAATPSDVYALGVIACELLTGRRPFAFDGLSLAEMQQAIVSREVPSPSALITEAQAGNFGEARVAGLQRALRGDLDAIVMQALRTEPQRRYGSVEQLVLDLRRYLDALPVEARRDAFGYRVRKFVRRHRVEVAAAALVIASMGAGLVMTTRQMRRAQLERTKTVQANEFLATMLSAVDPSEQGRDVTVAQVLSQAARDVGSMSLDPEVEAQIRHTLGQTYMELGYADSAAVHIERAVVLRREVLGELHQQTSMSLSYLAAVAEARGEFARAESLGNVVLDIQRRITPASPRELATALENVSRFINHQGRLDESMAYQQQAIAIRRASRDSASLADLPGSLSNLSVGYQYLGDFTRAETLALEALATEASVRGRRSVIYGNLSRNVASVQMSLGNEVAADSAIHESMRVLRDVVGPAHPDYLRSVSMLATMRSEQRDWPATEVAAREVVRAIGGPIHESHPQAAVALQHLGLALAGQGQPAAADSALKRSLALRRAYLPPAHWAIASSESVLGYHYGMTGRAALGERMLHAAYARLLESRGVDAEVTKLTAQRLAEVRAVRQR